MYPIGSHPSQLCIICFVLLCNCIHLSASPTRLAAWPKLRIFGGSNIHESPHREIRRSTEASTPPPISSSPGPSHPPSIQMASSSLTRSTANSSTPSSRPLLPSSSSSSSSSSSPLDISSCTSCGMRNQIKNDVNDDEEPWSPMMSAAEKEYRIQALKRHILEALHLDSPPVVKGDAPSIDPKIIQNIFSESEKDDEDDDEDIEHDVEKSNKQLIVGVAGEIGGYGNEHKVKLSFVVPADVQRAKSVKGKLWLGVVNSSSATTRSLFVIQRLYRKYYGTHVIGIHRMDSMTSSNDWIGIDLSPTLWSASESTLVLEVIPEPAQQIVNVSLGAVLEVNTVTHDDDAKHRRARRGIECQSNNPTACCLQPFSIHKDSLWSFILAPTNIRLNYCRGSCDSGMNPIYNHSSVLYARTMTLETNTSIRMRMLPCCTPKRLGDVQLLISSGVDGTFQRRTIPNLRVRECGCA